MLMKRSARRIIISSPAMEMEGWKILWRRSVEKWSQMETQRHTKPLQTKKIYGEDVQIKKEECINHVAKRVRKALRDFAQQKSRKGEGVRGGKRGSLTSYNQKTARVLQKCFHQ